MNSQLICAKTPECEVFRPTNNRLKEATEKLKPLWEIENGSVERDIREKAFEEFWEDCRTDLKCGRADICAGA